MTDNFLSTIFSLALLSQAIRISVPYILATLGGTISELGGVVNIALEGLILTGSFCAVLGTYYSGSAWVGLLSAVIGGALVSLIHGIVSIRYRANQIISGLAINILAIGLTKFFLKVIFHSSSNSSRVTGLPSWNWGGQSLAEPCGGLSSIPILGEILSHPLILLTVVLILTAHILVYRTPFGLRLRAVGEHPACADTLGIKVYGMRYMGVILSGILASLGGAWLAFDQHQFTDGMSGGRGYIALAAMIFGKWSPFGATLAALLFGIAEAVQIQLQTAGIKVPTQFIQMIPYLLTIIVLAGAIGRARPPSADGIPYPQEEYD